MNEMNEWGKDILIYTNHHHCGSGISLRFHSNGHMYVGLGDCCEIFTIDWNIHE